jgi:flagellar basal body-associated protein FliL
MQILNKKSKESEEYIIKNKIKKRFGLTFVVIIIIIFITTVAMTGVYFDYW